MTMALVPRLLQGVNVCKSEGVLLVMSYELLHGRYGLYIDTTPINYALVGPPWVHASKNTTEK